MPRAHVTIRVDADEPRRMVQDAVDACQPPGITRIVTAAAETYRDGMQRRAPRQSGRLAGSIDLFPDGPFSTEVGPDTEYAEITEFGGAIRPTRKRVLRYVDDGTRYFDSLTFVPSQPYVYPTFEQDTDLAIDAAGDALERALQA